MYVSNHISHSATKQTPHFLLTVEIPSLKNVRVFGFASYVLKNVRGGKFAPRAVEVVLFEFLEHEMYKVLIQDADGVFSIVESLHVTFDESRFPGVSELV